MGKALHARLRLAYNAWNGNKDGLLLTEVTTLAEPFGKERVQGGRGNSRMRGVVMARVVIVGGGISGLTLAYRLERLAPASEVTVLERTPRPGGKVGTDHLA